MKDQALFPYKDKSKILKCRLLKFLFGALRVKTTVVVLSMRVQELFFLLHIYTILGGMTLLNVEKILTSVS